MQAVHNLRFHYNRCIVATTPGTLHLDTAVTASAFVAAFRPYPLSRMPLPQSFPDTG
jgi:hypothetical protein